MKRKQSLIGGLDRILSVREASDLLSISVDELLKYYAGQREISLRNLLKRICQSNPIYHFPIIGKPTYTLKGVMDATGKGRSWSLVFLERNCVRTWCLGVHYLYAMTDVDSAWRKESIMWDEWIPLLQVPGVGHRGHRRPVQRCDPRPRQGLRHQARGRAHRRGHRHPCGLRGQVRCSQRCGPEDLLPLLLRQLHHRREVRHHAGRSQVGRCRSRWRALVPPSPVHPA